MIRELEIAATMDLRARRPLTPPNPTAAAARATHVSAACVSTITNRTPSSCGNGAGEDSRATIHPA